MLTHVMHREMEKYKFENRIKFTKKENELLNNSNDLIILSFKTVDKFNFMRSRSLQIKANQFKNQIIKIYELLSEDQKKNMKRIYITFYPIDIVKVIPKPNFKFGVEHINSGFSSFYHDIVYIHIFRMEESLKVLTHELIHAFMFHCVHKSSFDSNIQLPNYNKTLEPEQKLDEALVETWAILLTFEEEDIKMNHTPFSIMQAAKILKKFHCNDFESFWNPDVSLHTLIPQTPHLFPYYILKSAFLYQIDKFKERFPLNNISECGKLVLKI